MDIDYQQPPEPIKSLATAPATPYVMVSPDGFWLAVLESHGYRSDDSGAGHPGFNQCKSILIITSIM